eukprot:m.16762 g.16762  ORF g.16762 m.16762 type:complete len:90 (+) comp28631_c0_seq1:13-282(+)
MTFVCRILSFAISARMPLVFLLRLIFLEFSVTPTNNKRSFVVSPLDFCRHFQSVLFAFLLDWIFFPFARAISPNRLQQRPCEYLRWQSP